MPARHWARLATKWCVPTDSGVYPGQCVRLDAPSEGVRPVECSTAMRQRSGAARSKAGRPARSWPQAGGSLVQVSNLSVLSDSASIPINIIITISIGPWFFLLRIWLCLQGFCIAPNTVMINATVTSFFSLDAHAPQFIPWRGNEVDLHVWEPGPWRSFRLCTMSVLLLMHFDFAA